MHRHQLLNKVFFLHELKSTYIMPEDEIMFYNYLVND